MRDASLLFSSRFSSACRNLVPYPASKPSCFRPGEQIYRNAIGLKFSDGRNRVRMNINFVGEGEREGENGVHRRIA